MKVPMKTKTTILAATLIAATPAWTPSVFAADACEPIVKATQAQEKAERRLVRTEVVEKGKPSAVLEGIIVPEGTYHKSGDRWIKLPFSASSAKELAGTPTYTDCRSLGHETLDGVATNVYSARESIRGGLVNEEGDAKLWVAKSDGLPRKRESRLRNKDAIVTQFYSYGPDIQAPPTPDQ